MADSEKPKSAPEEELKRLRSRVGELERRISETADARHLELLRHARDTVVIVQDGVVKFANRVLENTGYDLDEFIGQPLDSLQGLSQDATADIVTKHEAYTAGGPFPPVYETRFAGKDGNELDVEVTIAETEYENRPAVVAVVRDITERKRAELALRETQERSRFFAEASFEGIAIHREGRIVETNQAFCDLTGYDRDEVVGMSILEFAAPESHELIMKNATAGYDRPYEAVGLHKNGSRVPVELVGRNLTFKGHPARVTAVRDLTERKQTEQERFKIQKKFQQTQKLESLGVLAGGIAHDFNNLLMSMLGNASLALMEAEPESRLQVYLTEIETAAKNAARLTKQMLAYSGRGTVTVRPVDVSALVSDIDHLIRASVSRKVAMEFELAEGLPKVNAEAGQIRQVVMNLVSNASEAMGDSGGMIKIRTGTMGTDLASQLEMFPEQDLPAGNHVFIEVSDNGCGMDEETVARIFDPFFSTKFTGRGLGLAVVLGIVRGHGGAINVQSKPGQGSRFRILFPAAPGAEPIPETAPRRKRQKRLSGTVLVVDDEESVLRVVRNMFEAFGLTVHIASNGPQALEVFEAHADEIAAVLLDTTMPDMDGREVFLKLLRIRPDAKVILSSGYDMSEVLAGLKDKKPYAFIQKPYDPAALYDQILEVLEAKKK